MTLARLDTNVAGQAHSSCACRVSRVSPRRVQPQPCHGMKADGWLCVQEYWPGVRSTFAKQSGVRRCAMSKAIGISSANARVGSPSVHVSTSCCHKQTQTCLRRAAGVKRMIIILKTQE